MPWLWTGEACMASASPIAVDSADAAKRREFIIGPLVVARLGSRLTSQGSIERAGTLRSVEKFFVASPLVSAPHPSEQPPIMGTKKRWQCIAGANAQRRTGRSSCGRQVQQIRQVVRPRRALPPQNKIKPSFIHLTCVRRPYRITATVRPTRSIRVPPVEANPATISAATFWPGWKRNGHAMGVAIT